MVVLHFLHPYLIPLLFWNCHGVASPESSRNARKLIRVHKITVQIIMEPRISGAKVDEIIKNLHFDGHTKVDAQGFLGACRFFQSLPLDMLMFFRQVASSSQFLLLTTVVFVGL